MTERRDLDRPADEDAQGSEHGRFARVHNLLVKAGPPPSFRRRWRSRPWWRCNGR